MVKKLLLILLLLFSPVYAGELDFGYSGADGVMLLNFKNSVPFVYRDFEVTPFQQYKDSNAGYMVNLNLEAKRDFHNKWDMFCNVDYLTDQVLDIVERVDWKIGGGYELFNNYDDRHKVSYALVYRAVRFLHSFRYKYIHTGKRFNSKAIVYFIYPTDEVRAELELGIKVFKSLAFTISHDYRSVAGKTSYFSSAGFKFSY